LAATDDFSVLGGYAMGNSYKNAAIRQICLQHTHAVDFDGSVAPIEACPETIN